MVCTSLGSLLPPLFYFLCSNLKANPVQGFPLNVTLLGPIESVTLSNCHIICQFSVYGHPFLS